MIEKTANNSFYIFLNVYNIVSVNKYLDKSIKTNGK